MSRVCKAAASAARTAKHVVAHKLTVLNTYHHGWSHSLTTTRGLLHGTRGVYDEVSGRFNVSRYAYGQPLPGGYTVIAYEEPDDFPPNVVKVLRSVSAGYATRVWRRWLCGLSYKERLIRDISPPIRSTVLDVRRIISEQIAR